jgi:hypothetical protein
MISAESNTIEQTILDTAIMLGDEFCLARLEFTVHDRILRQPSDAMVDLWLREAFVLELALNELNGMDALHARDDS